ncbi:MAG: hypothetical protein GKR99_14655 [Rhodobacteraceae bacterium]|nr:hypothetical protein [Paracoccaceae bacterium]
MERKIIVQALKRSFSTQSAYSGIYDSADAAEGMAALAEKRAPNWSGK